LDPLLVSNSTACGTLIIGADMTIEDLQYIFEYQIEEGTENLYFMLTDGERLPLIQRHPSDDLPGLLPMLDSFQYSGNELMPRFTK
jgi:hypothetical protein